MVGEGGLRCGTSEVFGVTGGFNGDAGEVWGTH